MYALDNAVAPAPLTPSDINLRELKAAQEAARRGRIYVRSTRVR